MHQNRWIIVAISVYTIHDDHSVVQVAKTEQESFKPSFHHWVTVDFFLFGLIGSDWVLITTTFSSVRVDHSH